jgi:glycosyltransferase involved in cell wall biosynthesis
MKILFDLRNTGLGNNGGSSSLINSANTLCDMGHTGIIIDSGRNQHTWTSLNAAHMIVKNDSQLPDADAIIATGYKSVEPTVLAPSRCGIKMHWIRGLETWTMGENDIINKVLNQPTIKLVNGIQLQRKLQSFGFSSYLIRPGYDIHLFFSKNIRYRTKSIIIGGLYHSGSKSDRKRTEWIYAATNQLKSTYPNIKLLMFGPDSDPKTSQIYKYYKSPDIRTKNEIYNTIHIWLAPTTLEGLHMPPAEAMLTECFVLGTKSELSGMEDYLIDGETGCVSENDFDSFVEKLDYYIQNEDLRKEIGVKARNKIIELGDRKTNMEHLIKLISSF